MAKRSTSIPQDSIPGAGVAGGVALASPTDARGTIATDGATATTPSTTGRKPARYPTEEQIRLRAYQLYLARKGQPGNAEEDWRRAEQELIKEQAR